MRGDRLLAPVAIRGAVLGGVVLLAAVPVYVFVEAPWRTLVARLAVAFVLGVALLQLRGAVAARLARAEGSRGHQPGRPADRRPGQRRDRRPEKLLGLAEQGPAPGQHHLHRLRPRLQRGPARAHGPRRRRATTGTSSPTTRWRGSSRARSRAWSPSPPRTSRSRSGSTHPRVAGVSFLQSYPVEPDRPTAPGG